MPEQGKNKVNESFKPSNVQIVSKGIKKEWFGKGGNFRVSRFQGLGVYGFMGLCGSWFIGEALNLSKCFRVGIGSI